MEAVCSITGKIPGKKYGYELQKLLRAQSLFANFLLAALTGSEEILRKNDSVFGIRMLRQALLLFPFFPFA